MDPTWDMLLRYMYNHNKISISELFEHFYFWRTCRGLLWRSTLSNRGNYGWIFTKFSQNYLYTHWQLVLKNWVNRTTFRFSKTPYTAAACNQSNSSQLELEKLASFSLLSIPPLIHFTLSDLSNSIWQLALTFYLGKLGLEVNA